MPFSRASDNAESSMFGPVNSPNLTTTLDRQSFTETKYLMPPTPDESLRALRRNFLPSTVIVICFVCAIFNLHVLKLILTNVWFVAINSALPSIALFSDRFGGARGLATRHPCPELAGGNQPDPGGSAGWESSRGGMLTLKAGWARAPIPYYNNNNIIV